MTSVRSGSGLCILRTAATAAVLLATGPVAAHGQAPRVFVLDQAAQTVTAYDVATGRSERTAAVSGRRLLRAADGRRLLVLDRGKGEDKGNNGFRATTKASVTVLDGQSLATQSQIELGTGLDDVVMLSAKGDLLSVVCPGFRGKTPAESQPRELITVDVAAGRILSRVELTRASNEILATPDGQTIVVLSSREAPKKAAALSPAELRFIDARSGKTVTTLAIEGDPHGPVLSPDGAHVYLLDRGKPHDNPDKNRNGRLHIVSLAAHEITSADAGSNPRGLVLDEARGQLLMLSNGTPRKGAGAQDLPGELRVLRAGKAGAAIDVAASPERILAGGDDTTLHVLGYAGVTTLSSPALTPQTFKTSTIIGDAPAAISADGRRLWVILLGEYLQTYDLAKGEHVAEARTGRMGKKTWLAFKAAIKTAASESSGRREAAESGRSYYSYTEYSVVAPHGDIAERPDGKAVYALNSQTDDVTIVDTATGQVIEKVAAGGFGIRFMPPASVALVPSATAVHAIDLASHQRAADILADTDAGFDHVELSPDARLAVVHGAKGVLFVNASTGKVVGTLVRARDIADVAIDWGTTR